MVHRWGTRVKKDRNSPAPIASVAGKFEKKKNRREAQQLLSLDATTRATIPQQFESLTATSTHLYQSGIAFTPYQDADHR